MARFDPRTIVLTGASGGIGEALALQMARPGRRFLLIARDGDKLKRLSEKLAEAGSEAAYETVDIRDGDALAKVLSAFDETTPVDLVIANAGVTAGLGPDRSREDEHEVERQIDINYRAAVHTVSGLAEAMRKRGRGQVVLVSSLAGLRALPDMPTYSATKAAIIAYGNALRGWLKPFGVSVTVLCPGFVTTPMSARHKGSKPFEISADKAAKLMYRAIMKQKAVYAFPFPLAAGIYLQNLLPPKLADLFMGGFEAHIEKDPRYLGEGQKRD
ncbi:short-subunit dehydrogenase [Roseibium hamelinense]|uniref:Short-subunit dehydrogenase n=1 Tax=Roseibium hamelinense TaxID=150831 RepID=A0A562T891_9HYPH|nr:SDR family NAD(P)-dependent oxidoreductase [Roseibium hamelinense]MTI42992.1 SDR family NAD(P)-dependent oxidoreductase [Roseibium hamelinense]TWI89603.1 short-subunit dehydrogenase [Roseibium hamelinense]